MYTEQHKDNKLPSHPEFYKLLIESYTEYAMFSVDIEGFVTYWNPGAEKIMLYRANEIIGKSGDILYIPEDRAQEIPAKELDTAKQEGVAVNERFHVKKGGARFWGSGLVFPLYDSENRHIGYSKIMRNLSNQHAAEKNLREERELADIIVSTTDEPVVILNAEMNVVNASYSFTELFSMKNSVIGKNFYEVMDGGVNVPELRTKLDNLIKANDFLTDFQVDHQHRRGDLRLLTVKARRIYQPPNLLFMLLFSDQVETEKLLKEKEAVISIAAHEVKTPISVIKAYSQILKRELKVASPITTQALDKINEHISNLSNLVSSLMDTSKMTPGDMRLDNEVFNLCELVSDTIEGFDLTVNTHHISISGTADCIVQADKMRIGTVITNLLSNAVKYSPNADKVIVNLEANDGFAKVSVQDFGIGIPERERDIIFEQFARTETAKKSNIPGHGIGLNLASKIVRLQGGEIGFITKEGEGSTFYFTLPLY